MSMPQSTICGVSTVPIRYMEVCVDGAPRQVDADDHEVWGVNSAYHIYKRPVDGMQWKLDSCYWTFKACFCQWKWLHLGREQH